jgi:glutaredoxin 2
MTLELYYYEQCPFCMMVLHKIDQLGLKEVITFNNTLENREHREFHVKTTGRTTVPCLYIDKSPLFESRDIVQWLEENAARILGE